MMNDRMLPTIHSINDVVAILQQGLATIEQTLDTDRAKLPTFGPTSVYPAHIIQYNEGRRDAYILALDLLAALDEPTGGAS